MMTTIYEYENESHDKVRLVECDDGLMLWVGTSKGPLMGFHIPSDHARNLRSVFARRDVNSAAPNRSEPPPGYEVWRTGDDEDAGWHWARLGFDEEPDAETREDAVRSCWDDLERQAFLLAAAR